MPLYFAYGSNMNKKRMLSRCPSAVDIGVFLLHKYRFGYNKKSANDGEGFASIEWTGFSYDVVYGVVYEVSLEDIHVLDQYEGVASNHYYRKRIKITYNNGSRISVYTYIPHKYVRGLRPSKEYLKHILVGAKSFNLPYKYIKSVLHGY